MPEAELGTSRGQAGLPGVRGARVAGGGSEGGGEPPRRVRVYHPDQLGGLPDIPVVDAEHVEAEQAQLPPGEPEALPPADGYEEPADDERPERRGAEEDRALVASLPADPSRGAAEQTAQALRDYLAEEAGANGIPPERVEELLAQWLDCWPPDATEEQRRRSVEHAATLITTTEITTEEEVR